MQELRLARTGKLYRDVIGQHRNLATSIKLMRHLPAILTIVESGRIGHVVGTIHLGLHREDILRIADVPAQILRHLAFVFEKFGQHLPISVDDRIAPVEDVKCQRTVVGVNYRLDGIAQVVVTAEIAERSLISFAVRKILRRRVSINDIGIMVRICDDVGIAIKEQERSERLCAFDDIPPQHYPALRREIVRDEKPQAVEFAGNDQLAPQVGE
jgi:hypothetical protein